jgi:histone-lysine N-methyltransferase SETMAR
MRRISAKFVPRLLSDDQKAHRVSVCRELKQQVTDDPNFISNIITGDETWVYGHDPETKQQSSEWKLPNSQQPKKLRQVRSFVKSMLIIFLTSKELSTRNSYPLVKQSMASFTVRS